MDRDRGWPRLRDRWRSNNASANGRGEVVPELARYYARPGVISCAVYAGGHRVDDDVELAGAAARCREGFVWIELDNPNSDDISAVAAEFSLPQLAAADAAAAHHRPKLDVHGDVAFVILKPVHYVDSEEVVDVNEIAIFLGPGFIATIRHGDTEVLAKVRAELDKGLAHPSWGAAEVAFRIADHVVEGYHHA